MLRAVVAHRRGEVSAIPTLLRSAQPLTADDRETLAHFLEGGFEDPHTAGRHKSNERWVAMVADRFLRDWQEVAKRMSISTYGKVPDMRDQAIEFVINEFLPAETSINRDATIDYMTKRPKQRRN
jgi:hypothetical protein